MNNKISFALTDEEKNRVNQALEALQSILKPKLISLAASDKRELPKMGDKTLAFVEKSLEYAGMYPGFIPDFIDVQEAKTDLERVKELRQLLMPLERITNEIDDTLTLAGSEAYSSSLSVYKVLKNAACMGQPGAAEASYELRSRFPGKKQVTNTASE